MAADIKTTVVVIGGIWLLCAVLVGTIWLITKFISVKKKHAECPPRFTVPATLILFPVILAMYPLAHFF